MILQVFYMSLLFLYIGVVVIPKVAKIVEFLNVDQPKDFLGSFCGGSVFVGGILRKIPMGTGGILEVMAGLGSCIDIFGGHFT